MDRNRGRSWRCRGRAKWLLLAVLLVQSSAPAQAVPTARPPAQAADAERPLGDIGQLLRDVGRNQKRSEELQREYTYHVHIEQQELDKQGRVKKTTTTDAESLTLEGIRINRTVARNGKPLTADELRQEDERIDKEVRKRKAQRTRLEDQGAESDAAGNELLPASRILELGMFSHPRRVVLQGRPTIVVDYAGDPGAKTRNTFEGVVRDLTGTVWIDDAERVMVRAQGQFRDDFKIGGGLVANIHKGTHFEFRATRLSEGLWVPASVDAEGSARILLVHGVNGRVHLVTSDYRRFRSSTTISSPVSVLGPDDQPVSPATGKPMAEQPAAPPPAPQPKQLPAQVPPLT